MTSASTQDATTTRKNLVVELDMRNFDSSIRDGNAWLVEFYAPWCGHCVHFAPTYEAVADALHARHIDGERNVRVGKVDGDAEKAIMSRFSINGFPSFFLLDGWTAYQYEGDRSLNGLVEYATKTYKEMDPIPLMSSPFGPFGQLRAIVLYFGLIILGIFEWLVSKGLSNTIAGILMCSVGISGGLFTIIFVGLMSMSMSKPKHTRKWTP
eukprot:CAMPEP_0198288690 /NCGR_PEP_ID=MMETSP1449-20131203/7116_1 /TAXON_ID=420275 /ORGANISM="Attheya septentrionalis, Strain CCMP2084" /LENGTH=209 /DNA_ID=CAMNT_0043986887 /DNA_START=118 /DNA_END=743 /DNA_ORIENTATION=-